MSHLFCQLAWPAFVLAGITLICCGVNVYFMFRDR
jgi:hypothetical protein